MQCGGVGAVVVDDDTYEYGALSNQDYDDDDEWMLPPVVEQSRVERHHVVFKRATGDQDAQDVQAVRETDGRVVKRHCVRAASVHDEAREHYDADDDDVAGTWERVGGDSM